LHEAIVAAIGRATDRRDDPSYKQRFKVTLYGNMMIARITVDGWFMTFEAKSGMGGYTSPIHSRLT